LSSPYKNSIFDFIIFSNIFIALCAVVMTAYTMHLFTDEFPPLSFIGFIFFSTLASYSIHWYLTDETVEVTDARTSWLAKYKNVHALFFIVSAVGCIYFLMKELSYIKWILPAVVLTLIYTAPKFPFRPFTSLKKFILAKTALLALMWTYVTSALPLLITEREWQTVHTLFFLNRFTLIFPICILFDIRDKEFDKSIGIKSLVTLLPFSKLKIIFDIIIILNIILSIVLSYYYLEGTVDNFILLIPTFLTYVLYHRAIKTKNDYLFYFTLDGLMAFSPILYFLKIMMRSAILS